MKRSTLKLIAPVAMSIVLSACGGATGNSASSSQSSSLGEALLGTIAQNVVGGNQQSGDILNSAINAGSTISGLIGTLTNSLSSASIVGTWTYDQPTVQFESENFLAKAGGALAGQSIINKIDPYYKKLGIDDGVITFVFNKDNTCTYTLKGKQYNGTYKYDTKTCNLVITGATGINLLNAYATVSAKEMAITFDTSKLLSFIQSVSSLTSNSTINTISTLSKSYSGMKTGFMFVRK